MYLRYIRIVDRNLKSNLKKLNDKTVINNKIITKELKIWAIYSYNCAMILDLRRVV